jgi:Acetyltransferase (GNAT) domain
MMISHLSFKPPLLLQTDGETAARFPLTLKVFDPGTDKRDIYALRYRAFIEDKVIEPREDGLFFDDFDELCTTCVIGAYNNGTCVGSFRLAFGEGMPGCCTMPSQTLFDEIGTLEEAGYLSLVEFGRMVIAPELTNMSFRTTLYAALVRAGMMIAHAAEVDYGLISVHPDKARFYEMMCGFRSIARAESYPGILAPAILLGRDFHALEAKRARQNPFFRISSAEISSARNQLFPALSVAARSRRGASHTPRELALA